MTEQEWGTYVAAERIYVGGVPAFNEGDPVPASHVLRGVVPVEAVRMVGEGTPPGPEVHARWVQRQEIAARMPSGIIVTCPRCKRSLARLVWDGDHAVIADGRIVSGDAREFVRIMTPGRQARRAAVILSSVAQSGPGRKVFRCTCKVKHGSTGPFQQSLSQETLDQGFLAAAAAGRAKRTVVQLACPSSVLD